jgi:hypothetical protein
MGAQQSAEEADQQAGGGAQAQAPAASEVASKQPDEHEEAAKGSAATAEVKAEAEAGVAADEPRTKKEKFNEKKEKVKEFTSARWADTAVHFEFSKSKCKTGWMGCLEYNSPMAICKTLPQACSQAQKECAMVKEFVATAKVWLVASILHRVS